MQVKGATPAGVSATLVERQPIYGGCGIIFSLKLLVPVFELKNVPKATYAAKWARGACCWQRGRT